MADELILKTHLEYAKTGGYVLLEDPASASVDITNNRCIDAVQQIGSSEEAINFGEISAADLGFFELRNLNPKGTGTSYITIRNASGSSHFATLYDGEAMVLRSSGATFYAISSTGTILMRIRAVEK